MRNTQKTNVLTSLCWIYFTNYEIITSFSVISRQWGGMRSSLQWRHNVRDSVWNHQPHDCLLNRLFRRRLKKTSRLRVTGLCAGNSPSPHKWPVTRKMFPFDDVFMWNPSSLKTGTCVPCIPSNLQYKPHQIPKLKPFSPRLAVVFAQSIEARFF